MVEHQYTPEQMKAISGSISLGRQLQIEHPEIADMYRKGDFQPEIARKLNLTLNDKLAKEVVGIALRGHDGGFGTLAFRGLIDRTELEELARKHQVERGKQSGLDNYEAGLGIHNRPPEQIIEDARNAGIISHQKRKGIHGRTPEQMTEHAIRANIAKGVTVWIPREETDTYSRFSEVEYAYLMSQSIIYQHPPGSKHAGKPNWEFIAVGLNKTYHEGKLVRDKNSTREAVRRRRLRETSFSS